MKLSCFAFSVVVAALFASPALATNLVLNGNFSSGNTLFTSAYSFVTPAPGAMVPPSVYTITPNMRTPIDLHSSAASYFDHTTGNDSGLFMAINGSTSANTVVWEQVVSTINPGADYFFSAYVSSWTSGSPASLQFRINGVLLGSPFSAPAGAGIWQAFEATWNSGASTSATISIVDSNTSFGGNDYGIDDIALDQTSVFEPVPEPHTSALLVVGLFGLLLVGRRLQPVT